MLSSVSFLRNVSESRTATPENRMLVQPNSAAVIDQQLISSLWELYTPLTDTAQGKPTCIWLEQVLQLPNHGEALQRSLKALALSRVGFFNKDNSLALQGNSLYVQALQSVQKTLWRQNAVEVDDIFVAGYVLALYEVG